MKQRPAIARLMGEAKAESDAFIHRDLKIAPTETIAIVGAIFRSRPIPIAAKHQTKISARSKLYGADNRQPIHAEHQG